MFKNFKNWWATPLVGVTGALLAQWANWPLPWIIGSMLAVILVRCSGWLVAEVPNARRCGQWLIATSIGLHLTQSMAMGIIGHLPMMLAAAFITLLLSWIGIAIMHRLGMDLTTAYLAFMPANYAEMISMGIRYRSNVAQIAAAHSVRLVLIILTVPAAMFFLVDVSPAAVQARLPANWLWLAPMLVAGLLAALAWQRLRWPNPWMFGALSLSALMTVSFDLQMALPSGLSQFAQLMIGTSLGSFIDRRFFKEDPFYLLKVIVFTCSMVLGTLLAAWALGVVSEFARPTLALGMMPGSSTEMYLTAEALHLGAGMVTAMHIMRLVVVMCCAEPVLKCWLRRTSCVEPRQTDAGL